MSLFEINNSSQPFLYPDHILYCYAEHNIELFFGQPFNIRPWKIRNRNILSGHDYEIPTNRYHDELGRVVLEANPSVAYNNNKWTIYWTAGFSNGKNTPIRYYYCSMDSNDDSLQNLVNFQIIQQTYTGAVVTGSLLFKDETSSNPDTNLVSKVINTDSLQAVHVDNLNLSNIDKITSIFGSDDFIVGGTDLNNLSVSYVIDQNYTIRQRLKNSYNYDVYKCSVFNNTLAYTVHTNKYTQNEHRTIVVENMG